MLRKNTITILFIGTFLAGLSGCMFQPSTPINSPSPIVSLSSTPTPLPSLSITPTDTPIPIQTPASTPTPISVSEYNHTYFIADDVDFSSDGQYLAVANDEGIWLWGVADFEHTISSFENLSYPPHRLAFSHAGHLLAVSGCTAPDQYFGCQKSIIHIINLRNLEIILIFPIPGATYQIEFSPNNKSLIAQADNQVDFWDLDTGQSIKTFENLSTGTNSFGISPDGLTIATSDYDGVYIHRIDNFQEAAMLTGVRGGIGYGISMTYSPDGKYLATGGCTKFDFESCIQGKVQVWNVESQQVIRELTGFDYRVGTIAFGPNGKLLAAANSKKLLIWDMQTDQPIYLPETQNLQIFDMVFNVNGNLLAIASNAGLQLIEIPNQ